MAKKRSRITNLEPFLPEDDDTISVKEKKNKKQRNKPSKHQRREVKDDDDDQTMATISCCNDDMEEDEYVMLDLESIFEEVEIPPNAPYVLSGLYTPNPILIIDDKIKLIGEYEETVGTCIVFSETDAAPVASEETGPSDLNLFAGTRIIDPNQSSTKQVKPIASLHKVLRFRLLFEDDAEGATAKQIAI